MTIHLCHQGRQLGAFSKEQVEAMLKAGVITGDTLAWTLGMTEWKALREILGPVTPPPIPPVITTDHDSHSASSEPNSSVPEKAAFDRYPLTMTSTSPALLVQLPVKKSSPRRILLWALMAVLVAGFAGFVLGPFFGVEKYNDDPLLNALENGFLCGFGLSMLAAYFVAIIVSGLKRKPFCAGIGIAVGLFVPGISLWPIVGAIRLAKPDSIWARKYYAEDKMKLSEGRFKKGPSKCSSLPTQNKPPNTPGHPVTAASGGHSSLWPIVLVIIASLFVVAVGAWFWQAQKHTDVVSRKGEVETEQQLYNRSTDQNDVVVEDNTPIAGAGSTTEALGIKTLGGVFTPLIEPDTAVPCTDSEVFSTATDGQSQIMVTLFRGTNQMTTSDHAFGRFQVVGIASAPRGTPKVQITFAITQRQILLSARDLTNGTHLQIHRVSGDTEP